MAYYNKTDDEGRHGFNKTTKHMVPNEHLRAKGQYVLNPKQIVYICFLVNRTFNRDDQ